MSNLPDAPASGPVPFPEGSPCAPASGFSALFQPPSFVKQFWWDRSTRFMMVTLTERNAVHGFVDVGPEQAMAFSQLASRNTGHFYIQIIAPHQEALLYEATRNFVCPFMLQDGSYLLTQ